MSIITTKLIRSQADRLLGSEVTDVDNTAEDRRSAVCVFNGLHPNIIVFDDQNGEIAAIATWLGGRVVQELTARELGTFDRNEQLLERAQSAVDVAGMSHKLLNTRQEPASGHVSVSPIHLARGLNFGM